MVWTTFYFRILNRFKKKYMDSKVFIHFFQKALSPTERFQSKILRMKQKEPQQMLFLNFVTCVSNLFHIVNSKENCEATFLYIYRCIQIYGDVYININKWKDTFYILSNPPFAIKHFQSNPPLTVKHFQDLKKTNKAFCDSVKTCFLTTSLLDHKLLKCIPKKPAFAGFL